MPMLLDRSYVFHAFAMPGKKKIPVWTSWPWQHTILLSVATTYKRLVSWLRATVGWHFLELSRVAKYRAFPKSNFVEKRRQIHTSTPRVIFNNTDRIYVIMLSYYIGFEQRKMCQFQSNRVGDLLDRLTVIYYIYRPQFLECGSIRWCGTTSILYTHWKWSVWMWSHPCRVAPSRVAYRTRAQPWCMIPLAAIVIGSSSTTKPPARMTSYWLTQPSAYLKVRI